MKGAGARAGCAMSGVVGATIGVAGGMMGRAELGGSDGRGAGDGGPRDALSTCRSPHRFHKGQKSHTDSHSHSPKHFTPTLDRRSLTRHTHVVILTRHRISKASPQNQGLLHGRGHRRSQSQGHTRGASSRDVCMHRAPCAGPLLGARGGGSASVHASVHVRPPDAPDACARPRRRRPRRWRRRRQPPLSAARSALETALRGYNAP